MMDNKTILNNVNINKQAFANKLISIYLNDLNKQKFLVETLKTMINQISSGSIIIISNLQNISNILPYFISRLGIPFSDLIINNNDIINYYINTFKTNKSNLFKNIIINLINIFNFKSSEITISNKLIEMFESDDIDIKEMANNTRNNKTEIEELYESLNSIYNSMKNGSYGNIEQLKLLIKQKKDKVDELGKKSEYLNAKATIEFFREKIDLVESQINIGNANNVNKTNMIFNNLKIIFNELYNKNINGNISNNSNFFNNFNINHPKINNSLNTEELNELKKIPLKDREFFYRDEELNEGENEYIEFKNYSYPFSQEKIDEIKRQYCGFLNSQGGRIYIGINDLRIVKGIQLDYKTRDTIRNELINYTYDFYPKCRIDKINVYFIPIKSIQTKKSINNLYVIQIIIFPGEPYNLYSLTNKGGYIAALRLPGQCINLTAEEIHSEIIKRGELLREKYINQKKNEYKDNRDIESEENENNTKESNEGIEEITEEDEVSSDETENKNAKIVYVVKITNIDKSLRIKDINRYFNGCKSSYQKFPASKDGKSEGYGEIHFPKKETAKSFITKFNRLSICGKNQINMKLKKRKVLN